MVGARIEFFFFGTCICPKHKTHNLLRSSVFFTSVPLLLILSRSYGGGGGGGGGS